VKAGSEATVRTGAVRHRAALLRRRGDRGRRRRLRAAIEARLQGKRTAIISKSLFGKAHTVMAKVAARRRWAT